MVHCAAFLLLLFNIASFRQTPKSLLPVLSEASPKYTDGRKYYAQKHGISQSHNPQIRIAAVDWIPGEYFGGFSYLITGLNNGEAAVREAAAKNSLEKNEPFAILMPTNAEWGTTRRQVRR